VRALVLACCAACVPGPNKNEVNIQTSHTEATTAKVTEATFDGNVVVIELGPRVLIKIASCYAHAKQKLGDHDHVVIELDHKPPTTGELDISDCTTKHVVATMSATFPNGVKLDAIIDTDLARK
jgi:hypothetical protein